jgi:peroxiredoxin
MVYHFSVSKGLKFLDFANSSRIFLLSASEGNSQIIAIFYNTSSTNLCTEEISQISDSIQEKFFSML